MARGPRLASWREPSIPLRNYLEGFVTLSRNWIPLSFAPLETIGLSSATQYATAIQHATLNAKQWHFAYEPMPVMGLRCHGGKAPSQQI